MRRLGHSAPSWQCAKGAPARRVCERAAPTHAVVPQREAEATAHRRHEWWREWPTQEAVERVDTLVYLLGRYPRTAGQAGASATPGTNATVSPTSSPPHTAPSPSPAPRPATRLKAAKAQLSALNASAVPARASVHTPVSPVASSTTRAAGRAPSAGASAASKWVSASTAAAPLFPASTAQSGTDDGAASEALGTRPAPATPLAVVEARARQWRQREAHVQERQERLEAAEDAARQRLLSHPPALFADEAAVLRRFGMGAFVSPHVRGFDGLFRQRWQDFHVTEMVTHSGCDVVEGQEDAEAAGLRRHGAVVVSRNYNYSIPRLPATIMQRERDEEVVGEGAAAAADGAAEPPSPFFFQVDVRARVRELQEEVVLPRDRAAVAHALQREAQRHATGQPNPPGDTTEGHPHGQYEARSSSGAHLVADARSPPPPAPDGATMSAPANALPSAAAAACGTLVQSATRGDADESDHAAPDDSTNTELEGTGVHYLQCTLHKQHLAHGHALANIAQILRVHPSSISVAGIKDFVGDTVQRVRFKNVSPASALAANRRFRRKGLRMTLSNFSYESAPLVPGDLFGNHFRVVLRDVAVPRAALADAVAAFAEHGFPNYYGCQRFSWFGGRQDAALALLRHNWLAFAFLFLNYTAADRTLRNLLQRSKKYPHPAQDQYRRCVVRRLRRIAVEPTDLDVAPFLTCPSLSDVLTHADGRRFSNVEELICAQLREAYFDLDEQGRRLTAQRLSSFLWNQALTLRLHHCGGTQVLDGDLVAPAAIRQLSTSVEDRQDWFQTFGQRVTAENRSRYTIDDVVHPGFSFDGIRLPENVVGAYYEQICDKYGLDWRAQHSRAGLRDFREPPRPIIRKPLQLSYEYDEAASVLTLRFALERGCYANVALSELMKAVRCLGSDDVTLLPLPDALWDQLGERDPGYVTTLQDIYVGYEDGVGFTGDEATVDAAVGSQGKVWDHTGPLFLPDREDPFRKAHRWSSQHLLRNSERRAREAEETTRLLFDRPLAKQLKEGEVDTYAGHIVPLPPNASAKLVHAKVMQRKRRFSGAPRVVPRIRRSTSARRGGAAGARSPLPAFQSLNKNSWNFTW